MMMMTLMVSTDQVGVRSVLAVRILRPSIGERLAFATLYFDLQTYVLILAVVFFLQIV